MKFCATKDITIEGIPFKAGETIAEIVTIIPRGNLASLLGRVDLAYFAEDADAQSDPTDPADQQTDPTDPEETDTGEEASDGDTPLEAVIDAEDAVEWFAERNVSTFGELRAWVTEGGTLTDAPSIGKATAKKLTELLGT